MNKFDKNLFSYSSNVKVIMYASFLLNCLNDYYLASPDDLSGCGDYSPGMDRALTYIVSRNGGYLIVCASYSYITSFCVYHRCAACAQIHQTSPYRMVRFASARMFIRGIPLLY